MTIRQFFPVLIMTNLLAACVGVGIGYKPPVIPISVSIDTSGQITFSVETEVELPTPIGTFSVGVILDPTVFFGVKNVLTVRLNGSDHFYDLHGTDFKINFEPGYYEQIDLQKTDTNILLEVRLREATPIPTETAIVAPITVSQIALTVMAGQQYNDTGLYIVDGQTLIVEYVTGSWRAGPAPTWPLVGPDGDLQVASKSTFAVRTSPIMTLVGGIGDNPAFPLSNTYNRFVSSESGGMWLGANDDDFSDNEGSLNIRITVQQ